MVLRPRAETVGVPGNVPGTSSEADRPTRPLLKARDRADAPPPRVGLRLPCGVSGSSSVSSCARA